MPDPGYRMYAFPIWVCVLIGVLLGSAVYGGLYALFGGALARPVGGYFALIASFTTLTVGIELRARYLLRKQVKELNNRSHTQ